MPVLIQAAVTFGDRVGPVPEGGGLHLRRHPHLTQVVGFGGNVRSGGSALGTRRPRDPSTNLNGAVIEGVQGAVAADGARAGAAAVRDAGGVHDGTDRAHRASADDVTRTLDAAAAVRDLRHRRRPGGRRQAAVAHRRSGTFASQNRADVQRGFDEISARIEAASKKFYLLSYCSPSRAGEHEVEVEANAPGRSGRLAYRFNANGFGPNCDPNHEPAFDMKHPRQPAPEASADRPPPEHGSPPPGKSGSWNPKR
jgi:hypothetical protein